LLCSLKSSSSCSRMVGVIRDRTISDRFSRLMVVRNKNPGGKQPGESQPQPRRRYARGWIGGSYGATTLFLRLEVHRQLVCGIGSRELGDPVADLLDSAQRDSATPGDFAPSGKLHPVKLVANIG
jgi:hypothetical protein